MSARSEALKRKHDRKCLVRCCYAINRNRKARKSLRLANRHQARDIDESIMQYIMVAPPKEGE